MYKEPKVYSSYRKNNIGQTLYDIVIKLRPKNIIEIGTYTGYSALCLAEGVKEYGMLHTLDINEEYTAIAKRYFNNSDYNNIIQQHIGDAIDIIPDLAAVYSIGLTISVPL